MSWNKELEGSRRIPRARYCSRLRSPCIAGRGLVLNYAQHFRHGWLFKSVSSDKKWLLRPPKARSCKTSKLWYNHRQSASIWIYFEIISQMSLRDWRCILTEHWLGFSLASHSWVRLGLFTPIFIPPATFDENDVIWSRASWKHYTRLHKLSLSIQRLSVRDRFSDEIGLYK